VLVTRGSGVVQFAGGRFVARRALVVEARAAASSEPYETEFLSGCTLVVRTDDLRRHGMLPDVYAPGYLEDAELSWRLRRAGRTLWVVPQAVAVHAVGASFGALDTSPRTTEAVVRHRLWFARRNLTGVDRLLAIGYQHLTKPARGLVELARGRPAFARAYWRGWWHGAFGRWADRP
jgi:GT2 family glycosyltransferase